MRCPKIPVETPVSETGACWAPLFLGKQGQRRAISPAGTTGTPEILGQATHKITPFPLKTELSSWGVILKAGSQGTTKPTEYLGCCEENWLLCERFGCSCLNRGESSRS